MVVDTALRRESWREVRALARTLGAARPRQISASRHCRHCVPLSKHLGSSRRVPMLARVLQSRCRRATELEAVARCAQRRSTSTRPVALPRTMAYGLYVKHSCRAETHDLAYSHPFAATMHRVSRLLWWRLLATVPSQLRPSPQSQTLGTMGCLKWRRGCSLAHEQCHRSKSDARRGKSPGGVRPEAGSDRRLQATAREERSQKCAFSFNWAWQCRLSTVPRA